MVIKINKYLLSFSMMLISCGINNSLNIKIFKNKRGETFIFKDNGKVKVISPFNIPLGEYETNNQKPFINTNIRLIKKGNNGIVYVGTLGLKGGSFRIVINNIKGETIYLEKLEYGNTIKDLKIKIQEKIGAPISDQSLRLIGKELKNEKTLKDYGLKNNITLDLIIPKKKSHKTCQSLRTKLIREQKECKKHLNDINKKFEYDFLGNYKLDQILNNKNYKIDSQNIKTKKKVENYIQVSNENIMIINHIKKFELLTKKFPNQLSYQMKNLFEIILVSLKTSLIKLRYEEELDQNKIPILFKTLLNEVKAVKLYFKVVFNQIKVSKQVKKKLEIKALKLKEELKHELRQFLKSKIGLDQYDRTGKATWCHGFDKINNMDVDEYVKKEVDKEIDGIWIV